MYGEQMVVELEGCRDDRISSKGVKTRKDAQVGIYNNSGVVDDSTAIARSPENAAAQSRLTG